MFKSIIATTGLPINTIVSSTTGEIGFLNRVSKTRFEYLFARDVATFIVTLRSSYTMDVQIGLQSDNLISSDSLVLCATNTFIAPGAQ